MTCVHRPDTDLKPLVLAGHLPRPLSSGSWGDLSVDQADGFGTVSEPELPSPDLNDDRGYGFGV